MFFKNKIKKIHNRIKESVNGEPILLVIIFIALVGLVGSCNLRDMEAKEYEVEIIRIIKANTESRIAIEDRITTLEAANKKLQKLNSALLMQLDTKAEQVWIRDKIKLFFSTLIR